VSNGARIADIPVWPAAIVKARLLEGFGVVDVIQADGMLNGITARPERASSARAPVATDG
jgi:hypothetical protein